MNERSKGRCLRPRGHRPPYEYIKRWASRDIFVDPEGTIYVSGSFRLIRVHERMQKAETVVGIYGSWGRSNPLKSTTGFSFDRHGHLYITDQTDYKVLRFDIVKIAWFGFFSRSSINHLDTFTPSLHFIRTPKSSFDASSTTAIELRPFYSLVTHRLIP